MGLQKEGNVVIQGQLEPSESTLSGTNSIRKRIETSA